MRILVLTAAFKERAEKKLVQIAPDRIEQAAVNAAVQACLKVPRAEPAINVNDKAPSIDGCIRIYEDEEHRKSQLQGLIHVQVKGTTRQLARSGAGVKYDKVEIPDLYNFSRVYDGALFLVVRMGKGLKNPRVYYRRFLPNDVKEIIDSLNGKETGNTTQSFLPLPKNCQKLEIIFDDFLKEKKAQKSRVDVNDVENSAELHQFENVISHPNPANKPSGAHTNDHLELHDAVASPNILLNFTAPKKMTLRSGSEQLETWVTYEEKEQRIICSNGLDIKCGGKNPRLNFKTVGGFKERLAACRLLKALIHSGELFCNGQRVLLLKVNESGNSKDLQEQINWLTRYASVEDAIHSKFDWNPSDLSDSDFRGLETFTASILDGKSFSSKKELPILVNLNLGNSRVKMVCKSHGENTYELSDLLCGDYSYSPINPSDNDAPDEPLLMPSMLALSEDDFKTVVNLDCKLFAESLERFPITKEGRPFATLKLLDMLHALDDGAICQQDLQNICEVFSDALFAIDESAGAMINCLQVRKRARKLDVSEKEQLMREIVSTDDLQNKAAAYLLLDDKEGAEFYVAQLPQEDKEEFESWPICKFRS